MPAVMIVTSDPSAAQLVRHALGRRGYEVVSADSADAAIRATLTVSLSAALLDSTIGAEELNSLSEWIRTRNDGTVGLVFLTSVRTRPASLPVDPERDQLVVRPFSPEQVQSAVERVVTGAGQSGSEIISVGSLELDRRDFKVESLGRSVTLTRREFQLLEYLAINEGRCVPAAELADKIWNRGGEGTNLVRSTMLNLRSKLSDVSNGIDLIRTHPRRGYVLLSAGDTLRTAAAIAESASITNGTQPRVLEDVPDA